MKSIVQKIILLFLLLLFQIESIQKVQLPRINYLHTESSHKWKSLKLNINGGFNPITSNKKKKKILILMSDTGGGHRASAQALDKAMNDIFPNQIDVDILDIWTDHSIWPFNRFVPTYRFLAKYPMLWRASYLYARFPPTRIMTEIVSKITCQNKFESAMLNSNPDLVVSVHPLCQHIPIKIVKKMNKIKDDNKLTIPFVTVVTDLGGAHETWFNRNVDVCFVPSKPVKKVALRTGLSPKQIIQHGLPVRPAFWKPAQSKSSLRNNLKLKQKLNTVLVMGGGDGVGGLKNIANEIANNLSQSKDKSQMIVICGHNKQLTSELTKQPWPNKVNVKIQGFCNNIDEYMGASDCIVTKAGPGTIAEAMIRGLPIVLSSFLPGQEKGNVPYVVDGGFGVYCGNKPKLIASEVSNIFSNSNLLKDMSKKAIDASSPQATRDIAYDLGRIVLRTNDALPKLISKKGGK